MPRRCKVPDFETFDIDVHDCPCGHLYGDHEYDYKGPRMIIERCLRCEPTEETD